MTRLPYINFQLGFAFGWFPLPTIGFAYVWNRPTGCRVMVINRRNYFASRGQKFQYLPTVTA